MARNVRGRISRPFEVEQLCEESRAGDDAGPPANQFGQVLGPLHVGECHPEQVEADAVRRVSGCAASRLQLANSRGQKFPLDLESAGRGRLLGSRDDQHWLTPLEDTPSPKRLRCHSAGRLAASGPKVLSVKKLKKPHGEALDVTDGAYVRRRPRPLVGNYEISWGGRARPSFFNRLRRVLGWSPRIAAAPLAPSMIHRVRSRTDAMWARSMSSRGCDR
jgi:hypothetical protein